MRNLIKIKIILIVSFLAMGLMACGQPNVIGIRASGYKTQFYVGEDFSINQETLSIIITDEKGGEQQIQVDNLISESATVLQNDDIAIDFSAFDNTKEGDYKIIVTFIRGTDVACDYMVNVKSRTFASSDCSVDNYVGVYDTKPHSIKVNQTLDATITYGMQEGVYDLAENPTFTDAGLYTVYFKMEKFGYTPAIEGFGTVEIKKADLKITPKDRLIKYGEELILNLHTDVIYEGFVNKENKDILVGTLKYQTEYEVGKDVGIYPLTLIGYEEVNYAITYEIASLQVERVNNNLAITFDNINYGEQLVPQVQNPSGQTIQYRYQLKDDFRWINGLPTKAGEYTIEAKTLESKNFNQKTILISQVMIYKRDLLIKCNDVTIYYGQDFENKGTTIEGFVSTDNESILSGTLSFETKYQNGSNAGNYDINISGYEELENYNIIYQNGNLLVEKAINPLFVTINDITYGEKISYTLENNIVGKSILVEYTGYAVEDYRQELPNAAGKYKVRITQEETTNYQKYEQVFDMIINPKEVTLNWGYTDFEYNGKEHLPTVTLQGVINGDVCDVVVSGAKIQANESGYTAVAESLTNNNYVLPQENTIKFIIHKLVVNVPEKSQVGSKYYNGKIQRSDIVTTSDKYFVYQNKGGINAGLYPVVFKLTDSINYKWSNGDLETTNVNFEILKNNNNEITDYGMQSFTYGENPSTPTYKAKFGNVEIDYKLQSEDNYAYTSQVPTNAGKYTIRFRVLNTANYNNVTVTSNYEIYKANLIFPSLPIFEVNVGDMLNSIELPTFENGRLVWEDSNIEFTEFGQQTKIMTFVPYDTKNYNRSDSFNVTINVRDSLLLDFSEGDIVVSDYECFYNEYESYSIKVENNVGATISYSLGFNDGYTTNELKFIDIGEYNIFVRATKEGYNDYYQSATLKIKDYIYEINIFETKLLHKGDELNLDGIKVNATFASGKKEVLSHTDFVVTGYDKNLVGDQYLNFESDKNIFEGAMRVHVYEPYVNQFMFITYNKDGNLVRLFSEETGKKEHTITFDSINNFKFTDIKILTDKVGPDAGVAYEIIGQMIIDENVIVDHNKGSIEVYIDFHEDGYTERYKLIINYDNEAINFNAGIINSKYNEQEMLYDMIVVDNENFENLTSLDGDIVAIYSEDTTEFNEENDLLKLIGNKEDLYYQDYKNVYVKVKIGVVYYVAKIKFEVVELPVKVININDFNYQINKTEDGFVFNVEELSSNKISFGNLNGYYVCYRDELNYLSWVESQDYVELILDGKDSLITEFYVCKTQDQNNFVQKITIELKLTNQ